MGTNDPLEPTPREATSTEEPPTPGMQIVRKAIALSTLERMAEGMFGNLVKAVVDVDQGIMAEFGTPRFIEFDSVINIRPRQGNRTLGG